MIIMILTWNEFAMLTIFGCTWLVASERKSNCLGSASTGITVLYRVCFPSRKRCSHEIKKPSFHQNKMKTLKCLKAKETMWVKLRYQKSKPESKWTTMSFWKPQRTRRSKVQYTQCYVMMLFYVMPATQPTSPNEPERWDEKQKNELKCVEKLC